MSSNGFFPGAGGGGGSGQGPQPLLVVNIDDPSPELNAIAGAAQGDSRLCYQAVAGADIFTLYSWDSAASGGENVPYTVDGSSGRWVAYGGKFTATTIIGQDSPSGTGATRNSLTGNARGANAVDWQRSRAAVDEVASGANSTIPGGANNTASAPYSFAMGYKAVARHYGEQACAVGAFSANGDAQRQDMLVRCTTVDATPTEMFLDGAGLRMTIPDGCTWTFSIFVAARDGINNGVGYKFEGVIKNNGGTVAFIGVPVKVALGEEVPAWDANILADDLNNALALWVTGEIGKTIRWNAAVRIICPATYM